MLHSQSQCVSTLDKNGNKVAEGHKASFCLEDTFCDSGVEHQWNCTSKGQQGITPNCYDVYKWNIDCQWIDITDVKGSTGQFWLRIHLNPDNRVAESDFQNNVGICKIANYGAYINVLHCQHGEYFLFSYICFMLVVAHLPKHGKNTMFFCCVVLCCVVTEHTCWLYLVPETCGSGTHSKECREGGGKGGIFCYDKLPYYCVMLCYVILCCVVLRCVVLCCVMFVLYVLLCPVLNLLYFPLHVLCCAMI